MADAKEKEEPNQAPSINHTAGEWNMIVIWTVRVSHFCTLKLEMLFSCLVS